jgi:hypothetical protein
MSFVTALALAVGFFVALPFIAHLLRRGKTEEFEFPPATLVPEKAVTARQRSRLEDRLLLSLRALAVLALAVLGATPLVRCSRLSVDRPAGASIAMALVIDDSHSMQSQVSEGQRWELALSGARQLLASARSGDAIAVLLAGRPARVALSPTSDLDLVKKTLNDLHVADRSTDLGNAVRLARSLLEALPQTDKRIIVLSDLADATWSSDDRAVSAPLTVLREATDNCAITKATRHGDAVEAQIACTTSRAAQDRTLERAIAEAPASSSTPANAAGAPSEPSTAQLAARAGVQDVRLTLSDQAQKELALSGSDVDANDDRATITVQVSALTVGVLADPAKAAVITGGATVIEQALSALDNQIVIKPISMLPDSVKQMEPFAALVVDDPPGLGPEARVALELWVKRGGVVLGLLGPAVQLAQLSSNLEPFTAGGQWQRLSAPLDARDQGASWLTLEPGGLQHLSRTGRVRLDGVEIAGSQVTLRWQDDVPLLLERALGAGVVLTLGLPAAVEISDLALRPVFLALLGHTLELAKARRGPSQSLVGTPWFFRQDATVEVLGPRGPLPVSPAKLTGAPSGDTPPVLQSMVIPELAGMYQVKVDGQTQQRVVTLDPDEILHPPSEPNEQDSSAVSAARGQVDITRELALLLLSLLTLELLVRTGLPLIRKKTQFS